MTTNTRFRDLRASALAGTLCIGSLATPSAADGQNAPDATQPNEEISITASRVTRSGFSAPTPTTVIGADAAEQRGTTNIADLLNQVPSFSGSITPSSSGTSSTTAGANFLNLRGLGGGRTLILVNGRRHVPTNNSGQVDINVVPSALIERVEVVTGGASAAWGSDAVAGVVNIIFKDNLDGFTGETQFGRSERGDNEEYRVAVGFGTAFADDRGRFNIAGELFENDGILDQTDRDWGAQRWALLSNPDFAPGNGQPARLVASGVVFSIASYGGVITAPAALRGIQFGPGGTPQPFTYGSPRNSTFMVGGDGATLGDRMTLKVPVERKNVFSNFSFDLTDRVRLFAEGGYASSRSAFGLVEAPDLGNITINVANAYLPAEIRSTMVDNGLTQFQMGRINTDFGPISPDLRTETARAVAGLSGELPGDWTWDAYYQWGQTRADSRLRDNRVQSRFRAAVDSVIHPVSGDIVCRSSIADPGNGCVPMNLFGVGSITQAAFDYVTAEQQAVSHVTQTVGAANVSGEPLSTWAGPVSLAAGIEYREDEVEQSVDAISAARNFVIGNPQALAGSYNVRELFAETVVPLLANKPFASSLELNVAGRLTDYSISGEVTTWKAGVTYDVNESVRLRATRSRDIRAPNLTELFTSSALTFATIIDPASSTQYLVQNIARGNLDLEPEEANTLAFGIVYQPSWAQGLRASVDYYDIDIEGAIGTLATQNIIDRCAQGSVSLCPFIQRDGTTGQIISVTNTNFNLSSLKTSGVDIEMSYGLSLAALRESWGGNLTLRLLGTYVKERIQDDGVIATDRAGQVGTAGGTPHWRFTTSGTYSRGPFSLYLEGRYIDSGTYDNTYGPFDIDDNTIPSRFYVLASARHTIYDTGRGRVELYGVIDNLLDQDPPIAPLSFVQPAATNLSLYDAVGRTYSLGARFSF